MNQLRKSIPFFIRCFLLLSVTLSITLSFSACRRLPIDPNAPRPERKKADFLIQQLKNNELQYDWFVAKAKAHFEDKKQSIGFSLQIRQQRDSLTWLTVKKVSVEGARLRLTPEKAEVLNHQDNEYSSISFADFSKRLQLPLSLIDLQQLLVGNPIWLDAVEWKADVEGSQHRLRGNYRAANTEIQLFLNGSSFRIEKIEAQVGNTNVVALLSDYKTITENGKSYTPPQKVALIISQPQKGETRLEIRYNDISFEAPSNTKFEIPSHYKIINSLNW